MLKNIRLHIEKDEQKQTDLDAELATHILKAHKDNINAFQRNIPSLLPSVMSPDLSNHSVFINKYGENNIVDYGIGRTLYGFHPEQEVLEQLSLLQLHCPKISLQSHSEVHKPSSSAQATSIEDLEGVKLRNKQQPMPNEIECLIVLGCGLGIHLSHLLKQHKIKNLLIYEPELQYFQCSIMITLWQDIFELAKKQGTAIFLQLEKDGRDIVKDVTELEDHYSIESFYLYKHYNHQVFNAIQKDLSERSWSYLKDNGFSIYADENYLDYLPRWTPNIDLTTHSLLNNTNDKYSANLAAFKTYFPKIYTEFENYNPLKWIPVSNAAGEINIIKKDSLHSWYGADPKQDCLLNFENFNEQPTRDGLVLGYTGTKLAHYIHYKFVKETEELLRQSEEEVGTLPEDVPSIIMFGLGVGYQLEKLLDKHKVEKLFICEPNRDFFYASLFAIDWRHILETVDQSKSRIYLNIGDDGTNLFRDLLNQFYSIGPYILNSTYFYQSYYNASLNTAITQLREQLQVVISMGEYFDHAYYGIEHTKEGMKRQLPVLVANPSSTLSYDDKEVPIFIVGNGPSLDSSIEAIKEWQSQSIVISCGTALQALHKHGITPDFHAEIEQNRSPHDWAILIGDLEYLKQITLISCNGIHPDTCDLYKDVMVAFKEGESSTVSTMRVLGQQHFELLQNAFPTVSNFVCDLFSTLGFTSVYLIGVDLGFVNVKHHHSKSSGYYNEEGNEIHDYTKRANTSLMVPGNFRPQVNTKHEFKVSRQVIEQVTQKKPKGQSFYNCSDGARIHGALPIRPDGLLIVATESQKKQAIEQMKKVAFSTKHISNFVDKHQQTYSRNLLTKELEAFETLLEQDISCTEDVNNLINKQKAMLFASYKRGESLLFYYLYGTVNYTNAMLTKLASKQEDSKQTHIACIAAKDKWLETIKQIKATLLDNELNDFDSSGYSVLKRERKLLELKYNNEKLFIVTDSGEFKKVVKHSIERLYPWLKNVEILTSPESLNYKGIPDYSIYYLSSLNRETLIKGQVSTVVISNKIEEKVCQNDEVTCLFLQDVNEHTVSSNKFLTALLALRCCFGNHRNALILPKYHMSENTDFGEQTLEIPIQNYSVYDFRRYLCISPIQTKTGNCQVSSAGSRGKKILEQLKLKHLINEVISKETLDEKNKMHSKRIQAAMQKD